MHIFPLKFHPHDTILKTSQDSSLRLNNSKDKPQTEAKESNRAGRLRSRAKFRPAHLVDQTGEHLNRFGSQFGIFYGSIKNPIHATSYINRAPNNDTHFTHKWFSSNLRSSVFWNKEKKSSFKTGKIWRNKFLVDPRHWTKLGGYYLYIIKSSSSPTRQSNQHSGQIVNILNKQATLESNNAQSSRETGTGMEADKLPVMAADKDEPIRYMTRQKATLNGAKTTKSLVKKFARFLRQAYPKEIEEMARRRNPKPKRRRSLLHGMANRLIHLKHRVAGVGTEKISKMKLGCGCATSDSTTELDIDDGELDKFRLFFSDPPLCRPEPTVNEEDMMTATDLCGHECQCHTESPATDNDKEIYITRPTTRNVTKSIPTTQCSCDSQTDSE
ncbi:unnamed protein product [Nesidiocoris tenuis]|uniref:Uncharacterized protein n=1 Tax=Nesidiocoris tenuis TaxID=355587 RepID=A0A6H5GLV4_9HEMI|nr:unnamed protein product [Nesidiocoris tenuis]